MNIKLKNISTTPGAIRLHKSEAIATPVDNNTSEERPLKHDSKNLSFKGLFTYKDVSKTVDIYGSHFGKTARDFLQEKLEKASAIKGSGLIKKGDTVEITEKTFPQRLIDTVLYPVKDLPIDLANGFLGLLKKLPFLKKSKNFDSIYNVNILKNRRDKKESIPNVAAIHSLLKDYKDGGTELFTDAHKRLDPLVANYNATSERTYTRIVTGMIPAFYLANDAYNLSIFMNDNKTLAKEDKKRRFNQEASRIGVTAAATWFALSLFKKQTNESAAMNLLVMGTLTFASEVIGRWMAGTPVMPLKSKEAQKYAKKLGRENHSTKEEPNNKKDTAFSAQKKDDKPFTPPKKGGLTLMNVLKVLGIAALAGFEIEGLAKTKFASKILKNLNNKYKSLYTEDYIIEKSKYETIKEKLRKNGFRKITAKYDEIIQKNNDEITKKGGKIDEKTINLGKHEHKIKKIIFHNILFYPIRFAWDFAMFPYKGLVKGLTKSLKKKEAPKLTEKELLKKDQKTLQQSLDFLKKIDKKSDYQERINKSLLSSLDSATKSNFDSAAVSGKVKMMNNIITSAFLIADNYNLVMIDSKGEDKELATQKAKERTIQRTSRIIYGNFLINFFNGVFKTPYNASLLGAQLINTANTLSTEILERKSVGMPIGESTREQILQKEQNNLNAAGFKGKYFKFMAKLTGKKQVTTIKNEKELKKIQENDKLNYTKAKK